MLPSPRRSEPENDRPALRFYGRRAGHAAGRRRPDRAYAGFSWVTAGLPRVTPSGRATRLRDRIRDPGRRGADRRLAAAHDVDLAAGVPHCGRAAVVLDRLRNGIRREHRASVRGRRTKRSRSTCATSRRFRSPFR